MYSRSIIIRVPIVTKLIKITLYKDVVKKKKKKNAEYGLNVSD